MRFNWFAFTFGLVALVFTLAEARAVPCFDSIAAARAVYPTQHLAYQLIHGPQEWFKGYKGQHVKCDDPPVQETETHVRKERAAVSADNSTSKPRRVYPPRMSKSSSPETDMSAIAREAPLPTIAYWISPDVSFLTAMSMEVWDRGLRGAATEWMQRTERQRRRTLLVIAFGGK